MNIEDENYKKGTTTVGINCKDGIILASEQRATMGHFIASKEAKKVYQISDTIGLTIAGSVGDAQQIIRNMTAEAKLYEARRKEKITIKGLATLLSNYLNSNRYYPLSVQLLIGGYDNNGHSIYSIDAIGGLINETKVVSTGSGSTIAYGVLEDHYKQNISINDGIKIAIRALHYAIRRDSASGESIDVVYIKENQFTRLESKEIEKIRKTMS